MVSYVPSGRRILCILASAAFLAGLLLSGLSCTKEVYVYPTIPTPSPEPTYHLMVYYYNTTQKLLGTDTAYYPSYDDLRWCDNRSSLPLPALADELPWTGFVYDLPHIKIYPESQILVIYNAYQFRVDTSVYGICCWNNVRLHGNCYTADADINPYRTLPSVFPCDSSISLVQVLKDGTANLHTGSGPVPLAPGDSLKLFVRSDTVTVQDIRIPGAPGIQREVVCTDTLVICNYGLLPKKYVIFDYYHGWLTAPKEK